MISRNRRNSLSFTLESLEGRVALSGGLAQVHTHAHAEVETHKAHKPEHRVQAAASGNHHQADDPATHDANDDKAHHGGGKDDAPGHH